MPSPVTCCTVTMWVPVWPRPLWNRLSITAPPASKVVRIRSLTTGQVFAPPRVSVSWVGRSAAVGSTRFRIVPALPVIEVREMPSWLIRNATRSSIWASAWKVSAMLVRWAFVVVPPRRRW